MSTVHQESVKLFIDTVAVEASLARSSAAVFFRREVGQLIDGVITGDRPAPALDINTTFKEIFLKISLRPYDSAFASSVVGGVLKGNLHVRGLDERCRGQDSHAIWADFYARSLYRGPIGLEAYGDGKGGVESLAFSSVGGTHIPPRITF